MSSTQHKTNPGTSEKKKRGAFQVVADLKGPLLIFLLALYFYFLSGKIQAIPMPGQLGPAFWPKVILVLLMISCGIKAVEIFFARRKESTADEEAAAPAANFTKLAVLIALVIGVVVAMDKIGFLLSNLLFLILFLRVTGVRKKFPLIVISVLGTVMLLFLFVKVVYLPLPKGAWIFDDVTIYLYRLLHLI
jgi:putative tricarboxylic transport membrane protein